MNFFLNPAKLSLLCLFGIGLFSLIAGVSFTKNKIDKNESVIAWDGYGYYLHLPSIFIYQDCKDYKKVNQVAGSYDIETSYQTRKIDNNLYYPVYPVGQALTWAPAFLVAHTYALASSHAADGFSPPYQWAVCFMSILFIFLAFFWLRKILLHYVNDQIVAISMLLLYWGSNYFYYSLYEASMPHVYLFTYMAAFIHFLLLYQTKKKSIHLFIACIMACLAVVTRNSEIFWLIIPVLFLKFDKQKNAWLLFSKKLKIGLLFLATSLLFYILVQLTYYKVSTGHWFINGYQDHSFNFMNPQFVNCLFGFYKGWFIYTPLSFLFFYGLYILYKKQSQWFLPIAAFSVCYIYLLISWDDWTYGATFGFRPIVQSYALFAIPLAGGLHFIYNKRKWLLFIAVPIVLMNLIQTYQYNTGILLREPYNYAYYKKVFLKTKEDRHNRIVIDIPSHDNELAQQKSNNELVLIKTKLIVSPKDDMKFYPLLKKEINGPQSLLTKIIYSYFGQDYNEWNQAKLITKTLSNNKPAYWAGLRLPEIMRNKNRDTIKFTQHFTATKQDTLIVELQAETTDSIIIHSLQIQEIH